MQEWKPTTSDFGRYFSSVVAFGFVFKGSAKLLGNVNLHRYIFSLVQEKYATPNKYVLSVILAIVRDRFVLGIV